MDRYSKLSSRINYVLFALTLVCTAVFWGKIPQEVPAHYGWNGQIDRWSDKSSLVLLLFMFVLVQVICWFALYIIKISVSAKYNTEHEKSSLPVVRLMLSLLQMMITGCFAYIIFCAGTCRNLGILFLPVMIILVALPIVGYLLYQRKYYTLHPGDKQKYKAMEKQEKGIVYRCKIDWWLGILCVGGLLAPLICLDGLYTGTEITAGGWLGFIICLLCTWPLLLPLLVDLKYTCYKDYLKIRCSYMGTVRIPYDCITGMKETHSPLSSAAMCLDRIQIDYQLNGRHDFIYISPVRKKEFMDYVQKRRREMKEKLK